MDAAAAPPHAPKRLDWPDAAKGIGILLVVAGHVLGGIIDSALDIGTLPLREIFVAIYTFHMPLFFLLSGLFVPARLQRDPNGFLRSIWRNIYYPYLLWSFIQFTVMYAAGRWTNAPPAPYLETVLRIPFSSLAQFWFLLVLAGLHLAMFVLLPRAGAMALMLAGLTLRSVSMIFVPISIPQVTLDFFFFYALGVLLGPDGVRQVVRPDQRGRAVIGVMAALGLLIMTVQVMIARTPDTLFYQDAPRLAASLLGRVGWGHVGLGAALAMIAAVIVVADTVRGPIRHALLYLGRLSMPIYVLHVIFVAGARIAMVKVLNLTNVAVLLPLLLVIGIAGPVITQTILQRLRLARPLGLA